MIPVTPQMMHDGGKLVVYAEHKAEYAPLVASKSDDGLVMTEWQLTNDERAVLAAGGRIRLWVSTFNHPLQPIQLEAVPFASARLVQ